MIAATRRWFRRNRTNLVIGAGVVGATYLAGQYVIGKIQEARQRMSEDRVAKENLRRRFEQNQDDCTYTVLALLPTVREEIIGALPVEQITEQLQQERQERLRRLGQSEAASSEFPSAPPSVADDASLQSGSYVHASQMAASSIEGGASRPKRSKAQLWQEMKINSITRALTLLYTLSLLTLLTRIQLNLLGRRTYLSSVVAMASPPPATEGSTISLVNKDDDNYDNIYGTDFETNRKYLTFSWWLLHRGSRQIMERVATAVREVFGAVNIREDMTLERLSDLIMQVRRRVEGSTERERRETKWLTHLLPPAELEAFVMRQASNPESEDSPSPEATLIDDPMTASAVETKTTTPALRKLLDETSDLVDSPTFTQVLTRTLDASFSHLIDYRIASEVFNASAPSTTLFANNTSGQIPRVTEVSETKCKLAHILPIFCKQAHAMAAGSADLDAMASVAAQEPLGNEYLHAIDQVEDLRGFAAVIYSSNFEYEIAGEGTQQGTAAHEVFVPSEQEDRDEIADTEPSIVEAVEASQPGLSTEGVLEEGVAGAAPAVVADNLLESGLEAAWKRALDAEDGRPADLSLHR